MTFKSQHISTLVALAATLLTIPSAAAPPTELFVVRQAESTTFDLANYVVPTGSSVSIAQAPAHGKFTLTGTELEFTPDLNFWTVGGDRFELSWSGGGVFGSGAGSAVVILTAAAPVSHSFLTSFEPGELIPGPGLGALNIGPSGAVVHDNGIDLDIEPDTAPTFGRFDWQTLNFIDIPEGDGNSCSGEVHIALDPPPAGTSPFLTVLRAADTNGDSIADLRLAFANWGIALQGRLGSAVITPDPVMSEPWVGFGPHRLRLDAWTGNGSGLMVTVNDRAVLALRGHDIHEHIGSIDFGLIEGTSASPFGFDLDHLAIKAATGTVDTVPDMRLTLSDSFDAGLAAWAEVWQVAGSVSDDDDLEVTITDPSAWAAYLRDPTPAAAKRYNVRFSADTSLLNMGEGTQMHMLIGYPEDPVANNHLQIRIRPAGDGFEIRADAKSDLGNFHNTPWKLVTRGEHLVEVQWRAATAVGTDDGYVRLFIDGAFVGEALHIGNALRVVETIRFGLFGVDEGTSGTMIYDDFVSWSEMP